MKVKKDIAAVFDRFCSSDLYSVAWAGQYQWLVSTDGQGNIHESISIEGLELEKQLEGWNSRMGMGAKLGNGLIRIGMNIVATNGLPLVVEKKLFGIFIDHTELSSRK